MGFTILFEYTKNGRFEMKDVVIVINYMVDAKVIFKCPIDYGDFPFHSVICKLKITSFTNSNTSMVFHSKQWSDSQVQTRGYNVGVSYLTGKDTVELSWDKDRWFSVVGIKIDLVSKYGKYILIYFIPTTMFTATSWVSHLLPPTSYPARTSLLVTVFLCQVGVFTSALKDNPNSDGGSFFCIQ